jgi:hypothetical protein
MPTAKKVSKKAPVAKKTAAVSKPAAPKEVKVVEVPAIVKQLDTLVELITLAKNNATGDRSPMSYDAEMDALQKALDLATEIRKSYD